MLGAPRRPTTRARSVLVEHLLIYESDTWIWLDEVRAHLSSFGWSKEAS
jgi:hypothetical protein